MKTILFCFLGLLLSADADIDGQVFKSDEPFDLSKFPEDSAASTLNITNLKGSIGEKTFENFANVKDIFIVQANLEQIDFKAFAKIPNLETIGLERFDGHLKLSNKDLTALPKLGKLIIDRNSFNLEHDVDVAVDSFVNTNLNSVHLRNLTIVHLQKTSLVGLKKLQKLSLIECGIEKIDANAFEDATNVESLNLDGNQLSEINWDFLKNIPKLKSLSITNNKLKNLHVDGIITVLPNLEKFWFEGNGISCDEAKETIETLKKKYQSIDIVQSI